MRTKIYFLRGENHFVVYVGKTSGTLENRLYGHFREAKKGHRCKKCNGIRKMLREGKVPTITLQTDVEGDGANAERAYIKWLRSYGIDLWNLTDGGEGTLGYRHTLEARQKCRLAHLGKHPSKETRIQMGISHMGKVPWHKGKHGVYSDEVNRKRGEKGMGRIPWNKGKKCPELAVNKGKKFPPRSEAFKRKRSESQIGVPHPHKGGVRHTKGRPWSEIRRNAEATKCPYGTRKQK
jgi:hypothetical protein